MFSPNKDFLCLAGDGKELTNCHFAAFQCGGKNTLTSPPAFLGLCEGFLVMPVKCHHGGMFTNDIIEFIVPHLCSEKLFKEEQCIDCFKVSLIEDVISVLCNRRMSVVCWRIRYSPDNM